VKFLISTPQTVTLSYFIRKNSLYILLYLLTAACTTSKHHIRPAQIQKMIEKSAVFSGHFTGFALYDPESKKMIAQHNAAKYFTPASNTKIFTYYTSLRMLGDSIPGLQYTVRHDSLFFQGTGDPSFLHPDLKSTKSYQFLNSRTEKLFYTPAIYNGYHYGPGWAWDDYNDYYSAEKSVFPVYGNIVRFQVDKHGQLHTYPRFFAQTVNRSLMNTIPDSALHRMPERNQFSYYPETFTKAFTQDVPFRQSDSLLLQLLSDTLHRPLLYTNQPITGQKQRIYSIRADSLYKRLMQESDNFIAEQLLLLCSSTLSDTLNTEKAIHYATQHLLQNLPDKLVWKDGSGLSRYNLFTPRSIVKLLEKLYTEVPRDRLFDIFPAGGQSGTIKRWYASDSGQPYIFAKTGTLSNVHCLSGYLVTQKGKVLLFSFMHNNYIVGIDEVRREMQKVLKELYLKY
jgi:serine-type D-Ala-D-Ala carboxypeptidase/endopeptidase (penicillin-binding protein 4)